MTINDSTFSDNSVEPSPLSRFVQGNIFNVFGFKMDPASIGGGGAINNHANGNLVVNDSEFRGNQAINSAGGAILNGGVLGQRLAQPGVDLFYKDNLSLFNSGFKDNQAVSGGAVASISVADVGVAGNTIAIDASDFKKNSASADGGVLYLDRTSALLTDSVFHKNNTGDGLGDKIYARDANVNGVPSSNLAGVVNALKESNSFKNLDSDDLWII